jgi:hypothetical protein
MALHTQNINKSKKNFANLAWHYITKKNFANLAWHYITKQHLMNKPQARATNPRNH